MEVSFGPTVTPPHFPHLDHGAQIEGRSGHWRINFL